MVCGVGLSHTACGAGQATGVSGAAHTHSLRVEDFGLVKVAEGSCHSVTAALCSDSSAFMLH